MVICRAGEPRPWRPLIPPEQLPRHIGKPTLVLDMNHTLVSGAEDLSKYDFVAKVPGTNHIMPTLKRPHVDQFLQEMAKIFELIAFTTCERRLADPILDKLDPTGEIFAYRLYMDSCSFDPMLGHVKDLSMLGRGLERVMIVDDSPSKCVLNPDNLVPISSFWDDPKDQELLDLIPFLQQLAKMEDVRPALREKHKKTRALENSYSYVL